MAQHVVIRREEFVAGTKERPEAVVFTQVTASRRPVPWGRIAKGDTVWMKWSAGPIIARAYVDRFIQAANCTTSQLRNRVRGTALYGLSRYWDSLPTRFFGMAIFCRDAEWLDHLIFPAAKGNMASWIVLDSPAKEAERLTNVRERPSHKRSISLSVRFEVLRRDGFACTYCGRRPPEVMLHVDHVIPWSKGGRTELSNLRTACADCNLGKGARLV